MKERMLRWFFFNLLFALVPLIVVVTLHWLTGELSIQTLEDNASEILFFALMISVTVVDDVFDVYKQVGGSALFYSLMLFFVLGSVLSSVFYGFIHFDLLMSTGIEDYRSRLMLLSVSIGIILFLVGTITQILLARITQFDSMSERTMTKSEMFSGK